MTKYKIVYCTPSIYIAGGIERVLTTKVNYFAEVLGYDIYIILTDGKSKNPYYNLSPKIHIIQLDINFEQLWNLSFLKKIPIYIIKQKRYKEALTKLLIEIKPDFTVSLLRREINFISKINDGSIKLGELHVTKDHYRNFEKNNGNLIKKIFSFFWMSSLIKKIKKLDAFIVLNEEEKAKWKGLENIYVISNPLPFTPKMISNVKSKQIIAVGRYAYEKGFDILLNIWAKITKLYPDWQLRIYGNGNREPYKELCNKLSISNTCELNEATSEIEKKYCESSIYVLSSRYEGFGMVIIEAMACGLPVIAFSSSTGPRSIIKNGVNGYLINDFDINEMVKKISMLIENKTERERIQKEGLATSKKYDIKTISNKWKNLFHTLEKLN